MNSLRSSRSPLFSLGGRFLTPQRHQSIVKLHLKPLESGEPTCCDVPKVGSSTPPFTALDHSVQSSSLRPVGRRRLRRRRTHGKHRRWRRTRGQHRWRRTRVQHRWRRTRCQHRWRWPPPPVVVQVPRLTDFALLSSLRHGVLCEHCVTIHPPSISTGPSLCANRRC